MPRVMTLQLMVFYLFGNKVNCCLSNYKQTIKSLLSLLINRILMIREFILFFQSTKINHYILIDVILLKLKNHTNKSKLFII